jgi:hypothetical protein
MSFKKAFGVVLAVFCVFVAQPARAEEWTRKSFLMPEGSFELTGDPASLKLVGINASRDAFGDPLTIAPHFYWAVTDDLSLGISHDRGLCLGDNCGDKVYNDAGFDLMYFLTGSNKFELALHAGVPISSFDPFLLGIRAGVIGRVNLGSITALVFDPSLYVGFSNRRRFGNREYLDLPFWFYFQATDVVVPFVGSALAAPLDGFFDDFAAPLEGGVLFDVARDVDVGFSMRFHHLLGPDGTTDARGLYFLGRFRF